MVCYGRSVAQPLQSEMRVSMMFCICNHPTRDAHMLLCCIFCINFISPLSYHIMILSGPSLCGISPVANNVSGLIQLDSMINKKAQLTLTNPSEAEACKNCSNSTCFVSFHRIPFRQISNYRCIASRYRL